jgi:hypothetical protein
VTTIEAVASDLDTRRTGPALDWAGALFQSGGHPDEHVVGVYCKNLHFSDPSVPYCSLCGIGLAQATKLPVLGRRPQLGVLILDDGTMFPLSRDYVLGRTPGADPAVASGQASPLALVDPLVSKVHARVVRRGWEASLVDAGSKHGTFVCGPGETSWRRLSGGDSVPLRPGLAAAVGSRQFCYHSYRNAGAPGPT